MKQCLHQGPDSHHRHRISSFTKLPPLCVSSPQLLMACVAVEKSLSPMGRDVVAAILWGSAPGIDRKVLGDCAILWL